MIHKDFKGLKNGRLLVGISFRELIGFSKDASRNGRFDALVNRPLSKEEIERNDKFVLRETKENPAARLAALKLKDLQNSAVVKAAIVETGGDSVGTVANS